MVDETDSAQDEAQRGPAPDEEQWLSAAAAGLVDVDPYWEKVIGGVYRPSGAGIPIRHIHHTHVKAVFDKHVGTEVADVIAALMFRLMIQGNREHHLIQSLHAAQRRAEACEEAARG